MFKSPFRWNAPENFTVPTGTALVVTDVYWRVSGADPNSTTSFFIRLFPNKSNQNSLVFLSYQATNSSGFASKDEHLTTGFVVSPGARMIGSGQAMLYGYLASTR
ncbi:MAG TPA: hypothetical protein VE955_12130 [Candidatus Dormibacteraeota bacterium]|nr:hypothetical protein [Candidatus Dormibacteraeota bacterium]